MRIVFIIEEYNGGFFRGGTVVANIEPMNV
jgi:hypothetical protein